MMNESRRPGSELFIVDNSDEHWKVLQYLRDWCSLSKSIDIATGGFAAKRSIGGSISASGLLRCREVELYSRK